MTNTFTRTRRGFTLLEMMLVLLIIGLLATVAAVNFAGQGQRVRRQTTMATMRTLKSQLTNYNFDKGSYPKSSEGGLALLVPAFMEQLPKDGWKNDFAYYCPTSNPDQPFDLISYGADGEPNTEDDISVWDIGEE